MSNPFFILHLKLHWLYLSLHIHREAGLVQVIQVLGCDRLGTVLAAVGFSALLGSAVGVGVGPDSLHGISLEHKGNTLLVHFKLNVKNQNN